MLFREQFIQVIKNKEASGTPLEHVFGASCGMHLKESPFKTVEEAFFYYDLVRRRVDTSNQVVVKNWAILKLEQTLREVAEKKKRVNL